LRRAAADRPAGDEAALEDPAQTLGCRFWGFAARRFL
jgi:hypothetical protein